ncbi:MAG: hypothetical protein R6U27_02550 [Desulfobacterales bacterium]
MLKCIHEDDRPIFEPILKEYDHRNPDWWHGNMKLPELCLDIRAIVQATKIGSDRITRVVDNLKEYARADTSAAFKPVNINDKSKG